MSCAAPLRRSSYLWAVVTGPIIPLRHAVASPRDRGLGDWTRRTWKCADKHRAATADNGDRVVHVFAAANERTSIPSSDITMGICTRMCQAAHISYCIWKKPWFSSILRLSPAILKCVTNPLLSQIVPTDTARFACVCVHDLIRGVSRR